MPRPIAEKELQAVEHVVPRHPNSITAQQIAQKLGDGLPLRTLQYRLKYLVDVGRLARQGQGRWARYHLPREDAVAGPEQMEGGNVVPLSKEGAEIRAHLGQPVEARHPAGYNRAF